MTDYKLSYSRDNECDVHRLTTDTMCIYTTEDIAEFFQDEELQSEFDFDINTQDDYEVNSFYITGSDLIDYMRD